MQIVRRSTHLSQRQYGRQMVEEEAHGGLTGVGNWSIISNRAIHLGVRRTKWESVSERSTEYESALPVEISGPTLRRAEYSHPHHGN